MSGSNFFLNHIFLPFIILFVCHFFLLIWLTQHNVRYPHEQWRTKPKKTHDDDDEVDVDVSRNVSSVIAFTSNSSFITSATGALRNERYIVIVVFSPHPWFFHTHARMHTHTRARAHVEKICHKTFYMRSFRW